MQTTNYSNKQKIKENLKKQLKENKLNWGECGCNENFTCDPHRMIDVIENHELTITFKQFVTFNPIFVSDIDDIYIMFPNNQNNGVYIARTNSGYGVFDNLSNAVESVYWLEEYPTLGSALHHCQ